MSLSLVTYTYNDHDFALDLLKTLPKFIPADEIIVVDDASEPPFPDTVNVRTVRFAKNLGPSGAKRWGIREAKGDTVLSIDCDIRMDPRWLRNALPLLAKADVALVGATIIPAQAGTYLSRALNKISQMRRENRPVNFLPGGLWLFRRQVWDSLSGFEEYEHSTFEDMYFCLKILKAGYKCMAADKYPVYEKRHLHRVQYCRRRVAYESVVLSKPVRRQDEKVQLPLHAALRAALDYGKNSGELAFLYIEVVKIIALFAESLSQKDTQDLPSQTELLSGALTLFCDFPAITALMREDLIALRYPVSEAGGQCWPFLRETLAPVFESGVLPELNAVWPDKLRKEDTKATFDFHYMDQL